LNASTFAAVESVRTFNRFYTREIGLLDESLAHSGLALTEARILFEIAQAPLTAKRLAEVLSLDKGYLSRMIETLVKRKLVSKMQSESDGRSWFLRLTKAGKTKFDVLESTTRNEIAVMLKRLRPESLPLTLSAMNIIENQFVGPRSDIALRGLQSGDIGWITHRQGLLYNQEYGWDAGYEALVAKILAEFKSKFDPSKENCWIAECSGIIGGSVFLVKETDDIARLRLLYVDTSFRGTGLGRVLVQKCTEFSRDAGYKKIVLWTQSSLTAARHIYSSEGYKLLKSEPHNSFGVDLIGETWSIEL
jgi:DNA-binding MarR family transcriptional regulator/GNAT superfamily N-acetyltransferase